MIAEAMQYLVSLHDRTSNHKLTEDVGSTYDGQAQSYSHRVEVSEHGRKLGAAIEPFRPAKLEVSTLTGFVDAIAAGVIGKPESKLIHIEDYLTVAVKSATCDTFGKRDTLLTAKYQPLEAFEFGKYYEDPQKFIIQFQIAFHLNDPDGAYLLKMASSLNAINDIGVSDDGINQKVVAKVGEIKTKEAEIKPRLKLLPRTTFDEAAPVEREFLIRLKQINNIPALAIFAVDGNKWKGEAMAAIKKYLAEKLTSWQILA